LEVILDTNAVSAWAEQNPSALGLIEAQPILCLPVIVLGEFRFGLRGSRKRSILEPQLDFLEQTVRVLEITRETAMVYATVRFELKQRGKPIPENDVWIAALARQHGFSIMSQDAHFDAVPGVQRLSW
jgi:predicted nucleic acid-binding protein